MDTSGGYDGAFAKKKGRACNGVALLWKKTRFEALGTSETWKLADTVHVALVQRLRVLRQEDPDDVEKENEKEREMERTKAREKENEKERKKEPKDGEGELLLTAVATHFKAGLSPEAEDMRMEQVESLLAQLGSVSGCVVLFADLNAHCRELLYPVEKAGGEAASTVVSVPKVYPRLQKASRTPIGMGTKLI